MPVGEVMRIDVKALILVLAAIIALPAFAQTTATKKKAAEKTSAKPAAKPAAPVTERLEIPNDATPTPDGTYSCTDKAGSVWTFSSAPFGVSKVEDNGTP